MPQFPTPGNNAAGRYGFFGLTKKIRRVNFIYTVPGAYFMRVRVINQSIGFRSHFNIASGRTNPVIVAHEGVIEQVTGL
jgi:hypothetical protein